MRVFPAIDRNFIMDERNKLGLVGRVVLAGGALVGGLNSGGCLATATGVAGYYYGKDKAQDEVVNVGGGDSNGSAPINYAKPPVEVGIKINRWKDNGDRVAAQSEWMGDIGDSVNLSKVGITATVTYYSWQPIDILYILFDASDNVIVERTYFQGTFPICQNSLSAGDYTLVAKYGNITHSRKFSVTR